MLSLVVHKTIVFVEFEIVHEQIFGSDIRNRRCAYRTYWMCDCFMLLKKQNE